MKRLILLTILTSITLSAFPQFKDTVCCSTNEISKRMDLHYREHRIGTIITGLGFMSGLVTYLAVKDNPSLSLETNKTLRVGVPITLGLLFFGTSIRIDSHKYFNTKRKLKPKQ